MFKATGMINSLEHIEIIRENSFDYNLLMSLINSYKKSNSQSNIGTTMKSFYLPDCDSLKYRIFDFFEKLSNKNSKLMNKLIKENNLELCDIWSVVPFREAEFSKNDLLEIYNSKSFKEWEVSKIKNRPLYASLLFALSRSVYLEEIWEFQVLYHNNNTSFESICCNSSLILSDRELFKWSHSDPNFDSSVYFEFYNPKVKNTEQEIKTLNSQGIKEINVVIKSLMLGAEELECFKKYCEIIESIDREIIESDMIK